MQNTINTHHMSTYMESDFKINMTLDTFRGDERAFNDFHKNFESSILNKTNANIENLMTDKELRPYQNSLKRGAFDSVLEHFIQDKTLPDQAKKLLQGVGLKSGEIGKELTALKNSAKTILEKYSSEYIPHLKKGELEDIICLNALNEEPCLLFYLDKNIQNKYHQNNKEMFAHHHLFLSYHFA